MGKEKCLSSLITALSSPSTPGHSATAVSANTWESRTHAGTTMLTASKHGLPTGSYRWIFLRWVCLYMYLCAWCPLKPKRALNPLQPELLTICEPPCRCWGLNPVPLEEQPLPLTTEPSLYIFTFFEGLKVDGLTKSWGQVSKYSQSIALLAQVKAWREGGTPLLS